MNTRTASLAATAILGLSAALMTHSATASTPGAATSAVHEAAPRLDILLTNDDGWRGPVGAETPLIVALRDELRAAGHRVMVVAPGTDQSGQGGRFTIPPHSLTVASPEKDVWTVTPGSPSDTVFFAFDEIYGRDKPDLVISGMNVGNNLGTAISHSGTVHGATTATELGVPGIAVSLENPTGWPGGMVAAAPQAAEYVTDLVDRLARTSDESELMPDGVALNVNIPVNRASDGSLEPHRGEMATSVDQQPTILFDYRNTTGAGGTPGTYTIGLGLPQTTPVTGTDVWAVQQDYVSISLLESDRDVDGANQGWLQRLL